MDGVSGKVRYHLSYSAYVTEEGNHIADLATISSLTLTIVANRNVHTNGAGFVEMRVTALQAYLRIVFFSNSFGSFL